MTPRENNQATWNRQDRDLLVELSTRMQVMQEEMAKVYAEIKDINSGITSRLMNLEGNSVSKIELKHTDGNLAALEKRVRELEDKSNQWLGRGSLISILFSAIVALIAAYIGTGKPF